LGSYQAGVYEAMAEHGYHPDLITGISIGAINCSIIAGNPPEDRVARLRQFWEQVSSPSASWPDFPQATWQDAVRRTAAAAAPQCGARAFRPPNARRSWTAGARLTSYSNTSNQRRPLERLVDFDGARTPVWRGRRHRPYGELCIFQQPPPHHPAG